MVRLIVFCLCLLSEFLVSVVLVLSMWVSMVGELLLMVV